MTRQSGDLCVAGAIDRREASARLPTIRVELIDAMTDLLVLAGGGCERAVIAQALIGHIVEAVVWWHGSSPDEGELESLNRLTEAAAAHTERMLQRFPRGDPSI